MEVKNPKQRKWLLATGLFVFAFLLYANTLSNEYAYDDNIIILDNYTTQKGVSAIPQIFSETTMSGFNKEKIGYRPVTLSLFAIEYQLFGKNPTISHLINVLLYSFTAVILLFLLSLLFAQLHFLIPLSMTLLFIAHPVHTEVIANIKSRDEILAFLGCISSVYLLLRHVHTGKVIYYLLNILIYVAAGFSKENTMTFVAIIPLTLFYFTELKTKKIILYTLPYFIFWVLEAGIYKVFMGEYRYPTLIENSLLAANNMSEKYATILYILGRYLSLLFFPHPLVFTYRYHHIPVMMMNDWRVILSLLTHLGLIIYCVINLRKKYFIAYGILFYFFAISIFSNILMLAPDPMAERFLYMPSLGFCIVLPLVLKKIIELSGNKKIRYNLLFAIIIALLIPFIAKTISRNKDWKNNLTLFSHDIQYIPECASAHLFLGKEIFAAYYKTSNPEEKNNIIRKATKEINEAIRIYPQYAEAWNALGTLSLSLGDARHSMEYYDRALNIQPDYAEVYYFKGNYYRDVNKISEAIRYYESAIRYSPFHLDANTNLGAMYFKAGDLKRAREFTMKAMAIDPTQPILYNNIGSIAMNEGNNKQAIEYFLKAIQLDTLFYQSYFFLGEAYKKTGNAEMSEYYYKKSNEMKSKRGN